MNALTLFPNNSIVSPHIHKFNTFWQVRHLCQAGPIWHKSFWRSAQNAAARKPALSLGLRAFSLVQKSYFCTASCNICANPCGPGRAFAGRPVALRPARPRFFCAPRKKRGAPAFRSKRAPSFLFLSRASNYAARHSAWPGKAWGAVGASNQRRARRT